MVHTVHSDIFPNLYRISVALPGNPLKSLNSYVIVGADRNLIVDTGFNLPESLEDLRGGIGELGLDMGKTDIFLTHFHADHCGLVPRIVSPDSVVYMSALDRDLFNDVMDNGEDFWTLVGKRLLDEGYPRDELTRTQMANPARKYLPEVKFDSVPVAEGTRLSYGDFRLECVWTPGHTPGHVCLYDKAKGVFFSGDHVLFDITPNITAWATMPNSLQHYLNSLMKVRDYPVRVTLTGHRENDGVLSERVDQLIAHHENRLADVESILEKHPGLSGYEVASCMKWDIRAKTWADFPPGQRWFAVGEALSHLNCLIAQGKAKKIEKGGVNTYFHTYFPDTGPNTPLGHPQHSFDGADKWK
ncbi:MAG: MBL fold metallo-hydrolase [Synergistaceae bacterium]|jgi:glyoxylase-like metal-dependent hydrolase (beta-lactamase superfamily II)|nr:MBL fold metallo-hydrolase [Synergistaceae bacterium]